MTQARAMSSSGVRESPSPRRMPLTALYPTMKGMAQGAEKEVLPGGGQGLGGHLHQVADGVEQEQGGGAEGQGEQPEHPEDGLDRAGHLPPPTGAVVLADEHRPPRGQADGEAGDGLHHLAAGGHRADPHRVGKPPHHEQVRGPVAGLQDVCQQKGEREPHQCPKGAPLRQPPSLHFDSPQNSCIFSFLCEGGAVHALRRDFSGPTGPG